MMSPISSVRTPTPKTGMAQANDPRERVRCLRLLVRELDALGVIWVVRGAPGELLRWVRAHSAKDLDLWAPSQHAEAIVAAAIRAGGVPTCARSGIAGRPGLLSAMFMYLAPGGWPIGTVDISFGPPRAGVIELGDEVGHAREVVRPAGIPRFAGTSVLRELLLRRALRGKSLEASHIDHARRVWVGLSHETRAQFRAELGQRFGPAAERLCGTGLDDEQGDFPWRSLRRELVQGAVRTRPFLLADFALDRLLANRSPRRRERFPGGARPVATTIAIVGTDGTGKSSLVDGLTATLRRFGLHAEPLYFGRVRGGVLMSDSLRGLAERWIKPTSIADSTAKSGQRVRPKEQKLRWLASYVYLLDYASRLTFRVFPSWAQNHMIVMDRYVYDLHLMPHASATAARLAEVLAPKPRLLFFLDVDSATILARRQERTLPEVHKQQGILREVCARVGAGTRYFRVASTAPVDDLVHQLARAVVAAAHRREIGVPWVLDRLFAEVGLELARPTHSTTQTAVAPEPHG